MFYLASQSNQKDVLIRQVNGSVVPSRVLRDGTSVSIDRLLQVE